MRRILALVLVSLTALIAVGATTGVPKAEAASANQKIAFDYFVSIGYSKVQAAGIVGNLIQESNVNPQAVQPNGVGHGIAQWSRGGRWDTSANANVVWFAATQSKSAYDLGLQLQFIRYELDHFGYGKAQLLQATTIEAATEVFAAKFEICGTCMMANRINYANQVYRDYAGGNPPSSGWPTLSNGATGWRVSVLQELLRAKGQALVVDGSYGPATTAAVTSFQASAGLVRDGIAGPNTWSSVTPDLSQGAVGDAVKALQLALNAHGAKLVVDGDFGPATTAAVKAFQASTGLVRDGIVGPRTWSALV